MTKLAVFFPGIGYTVDKPLLHYSRRIAQDLGYDIRLLTYSGFPKGVKGDRAKMVESYNIALAQSREMLTGIDLTQYEDVLFVGKSIGTIIAAQIASESPVTVRLILYTPLEDTFLFPVEKAIVFTGSADPWVGGSKSRISQLCREREIPCIIIPEGNHSLESKNLEADIRNMQMIMKETDRFVRK